jgi:hypothetical protein
MHPTCDGGACTFERCWMPSCKGGACTNINPMELEQPKPQYVAYRVTDTSSSGGSPSLRGGPISLPEMGRFENGKLPPPPPPNRMESNQIGDPEELNRLMLQQEVEARMLSDLRIKAEAGVIKNEERVQLKYLEARAESETKKREWEQHQREVEQAYEVIGFLLFHCVRGGSVRIIISIMLPFVNPNTTPLYFNRKQRKLKQR